MFSQTVDYALRAMLYLATVERVTVNSETIAAATGVPAGYLSKIMRDLVVAGLVHSFRGPHGGFALSRDPMDISILDVVAAVESAESALRTPVRRKHGKLPSLHRWLGDAAGDIERAMRCTSLAQVLKADEESRDAR